MYATERTTTNFEGYLRLKITDKTGNELATTEVSKLERLNEAIANIAGNLGMNRRDITYQIIGTTY